MNSKTLIWSTTDKVTQIDPLHPKKKIKSTISGEKSIKSNSLFSQYLLISHFSFENIGTWLQQTEITPLVKSTACTAPADWTLPLLAEGSWFSHQTNWEFSFAIGHCLAPQNRTQHHLHKNWEGQGTPRNLVGFGLTCMSQSYGVALVCSRKKSHSSHSTSVLLWGCYNKPRTDISVSYISSADITELPSSFCKDAAIRSQLSVLLGLSASSTQPGHLKSATTIDPIIVNLNSQAPPPTRKEALQKITQNNLQVTDRAEEQLPKVTSSF